MPIAKNITAPMVLAVAIASMPVVLHAQAGTTPEVNTNAGAPATVTADPPQTSTTTSAPADSHAGHGATAEASEGQTVTQVAAFIDQHFPKADKDGDGMLSEAEFKTWISAMRESELKSSGKPASGAEAKTYASNAFAKADMDTDKRISRDELARFLAG